MEFRILSCLGFWKWCPCLPKLHLLTFKMNSLYKELAMLQSCTIPWWLRLSKWPASFPGEYQTLPPRCPVFFNLLNNVLMVSFWNSPLGPWWLFWKRIFSLMVHYCISFFLFSSVCDLQWNLLDHTLNFFFFSFSVFQKIYSVFLGLVHI